MILVFCMLIFIYLMCHYYRDFLRRKKRNDLMMAITNLLCFIASAIIFLIN
jgi:hypothetical protein